MEISYDAGNMALTVVLPEKLIPSGAEDAGQEIAAELGQRKDSVRYLWLDAKHTVYISSYAIRILLMLVKSGLDVTVLNAQPAIIETAVLTGINSVIDFFPPIKPLPMDNALLIGQGKNGSVFRIGEDQICKVFEPRSSLPDVLREKRFSRKIFQMGLPTVLSFQIVMVQDCYGIVYEMMSARTLSEVFQKEPESIDGYLDRFVRFLEEIHRVPAEGLPDKKANFKEHIISKVYHSLDTDRGEKLLRVFESVPDGTGFVHGDLHFANLFPADGGFVMIDLDSAGFGDGLWDIAALYSTLVAFQYINPEDVMHLGSTEKYFSIWKAVLEKWTRLKTLDMKKTEHTVSVLSLARVIVFCERHGYSPEARQMMLEKLCAALDEI